MSSASPEFWHRRNDRVGNILSLTALTCFANCPHGFRLGRCVLRAGFSTHSRPPENIALGINVVGGWDVVIASVQREQPMSYWGAGSSYPHPPRMDSLRIVRRRRLWVTAGGGAFLRLVATRLIDVFLQHVEAILKSRTLVANNRILALFFRRSERARRSLLRTSSSRSHTGSNSVLISSRSRMRNASMCFSSSAMQRTSHGGA